MGILSWLASVLKGERTEVAKKKLGPQSTSGYRAKRELHNLLKKEVQKG